MTLLESKNHTKEKTIMTLFKQTALGALIPLLVLLGACATQHPPVSQSEVSVTEATVIAIDHAQRQVTLKEKDGTESTLNVVDAVKNLDQVQVGDVIRITQTQTVAWQLRKSGEASPDVSVQDSASVAKPGEKPAMQRGRTVNITATITAIDQAKGTVTLRGPDGHSQTIKAADPNNLKKVAVGDLVDISYTESVAIDVVPVTKK
jgi:arginine repressor